MEPPSTLSPPLMRQPFTPPPQRDGEDAGDGHDAVLQSNGHLNSGLGLKKNAPSAGVEGLAICASPSDYAPQPKRKSRNADSSVPERESLASMIRKGVVEHQLGLSLNLILLVGMSWCLFPSLRDTLHAYFLLSYRTERSDGEILYGQGPRDLLLVVALVVYFTAIRAFMLDYVLMPLAGLLGIRRKKGRVRFAEQAHLLLYYIVYWNWGLYLLVRDMPSSLPHASGSSASPVLSLSSVLISLWTNFPRLLLGPSMKLYYLSQLAFWAQQIVVIHLEERRKDHYQMLTHHFVTVALMSTSYGYRQWRVGNAVLVCMDIVDLILPLAKILKYTGWQKACDVAFALFVVVWLAARHAAYLTICWSIYAHINEATMPYGTYSLKKLAPNASNTGLRLSPDGGDKVWENIFQPYLDPNAETVSFNERIRWGFLGLLLGLQCITLMWFVLIVKVIAKVIRGEGAEDNRSDDEGEDGSDEADTEEGPGPAQPSVPFATSEAKVNAPRKYIEVEADSTEYVRRSTSNSGSRRPRSSKGGTFSSGLNLGERKEILNRIGCLSDEQLAREKEKKDEMER